jgi:hypothetical protein
VNEKVLTVHMTNGARLNREALVELRTALLHEAGLGE